MTTNNQNTGSSGFNKNNVQTSAQSPDKTALQTTGRDNEAREEGADGPQLERFVAYMKENWKPILTQLVAVGVTAYLTHDAKTKMANRAKSN